MHRITSPKCMQMRNIQYDIASISLSFLIRLLTWNLCSQRCIVTFHVCLIELWGRRSTIYIVCLCSPSPLPFVCMFCSYVACFALHHRCCAHVRCHLCCASHLHTCAFCLGPVEDHAGYLLGQEGPQFIFVCACVRMFGADSYSVVFML